VDDEAQRVCIPEKLVRWAVEQAPERFSLYGPEPDFELKIGGDRVQFAGLGTPTRIIDVTSSPRYKSGELPTTSALTS
jgi:trimethylamine:corrinoid methyltransferase-like protein